MSLLLVGSILFNYILGLQISKSENDIARKRILVFGIVSNLMLLGFFKYTIFVLDLLHDTSELIGHSISVWKPEILLPVGISFYTFHNISYLIEIKRKNIFPSKSVIDFSVYDVFFPLLLAGPIERPNSLIPQLESNRKVNFEGILNGFSVFAWGIFLKTVIADPLAKFVDYTLGKGSDIPPGILWIVAPAFAFQVYADFSGYSNCARGLAHMMGFRLMKNFHRPFFASSPTEFWQRWHISLSSWLRDYVYFPLGGNRMGFLRQNINIIIVWILGGLWHGATYGYLIWGIYLGACIVLYNYLNLIPKLFHSQLSQIILKFVGWGLTFFSFAFGLLLFRVKDFDELVTYLVNIFSFSSEAFSWWYVILFFIPVIAFDFWQKYLDTTETDWRINQYPLVFWTSFSILFLVFALVSPFAKQEFFYFQF